VLQQVLLLGALLGGDMVSPVVIVAHPCSWRKLPSGSKSFAARLAIPSGDDAATRRVSGKTQPRHEATNGTPISIVAHAR